MTIHQDQIDAIRDQLSKADEASNYGSAIGHILLALANIADILEESAGPTIRPVTDEAHPFRSLAGLIYTECPCGCGIKGVCAKQAARVKAHDDAIPF